MTDRQGGTFRCLLLRIDKKLHHYDHALWEGCFLRVMSPGSDSPVLHVLTRNAYPRRKCTWFIQGEPCCLGIRITTVTLTLLFSTLYAYASLYYSLRHLKDKLLRSAYNYCMVMKSFLAKLHKRTQSPSFFYIQNGSEVIPVQ